MTTLQKAIAAMVARLTDEEVDNHISELAETNGKKVENKNKREALVGALEIMFMDRFKLDLVAVYEAGVKEGQQHTPNYN